MKYVGIQTQISRNNTRSCILLLAFPTIILGMMYAILWAINAIVMAGKKLTIPLYNPNEKFLQYLPYAIIIVGAWFLIAYFIHSTLICAVTGSKPLDRKENKRVYNVVENLCIQEGMRTPRIYIINDDSLNAFASGINKSTYAISLSKGIIEKLDDDELQSVIAHELSHIKNRDVRLLIISIIFVGILAFLTEMLFRQVLYGNLGGRKKDKDNILITLAILGIVSICYLFSIIIRFGISRSREYMADAGAAEMTKKPYALANALSKIKGDPQIEAVKNRDVAQLFIENPQVAKKSFWDNLFSTHPPIDKRIQLLNQYA